MALDPHMLRVAASGLNGQAAVLHVTAEHMVNPASLLVQAADEIDALRASPPAPFEVTLVHADGSWLAEAHLVGSTGSLGIGRGVTGEIAERVAVADTLVALAGLVQRGVTVPPEVLALFSRRILDPAEEPKA